MSKSSSAEMENRSTTNKFLQNLQLMSAYSISFNQSSKTTIAYNNMSCSPSVAMATEDL